MLNRMNMRVLVMIYCTRMMCEAVSGHTILYVIIAPHLVLGWKRRSRTLKPQFINIYPTKSTPLKLNTI